MLRVIKCDKECLKRVMVVKTVVAVGLIAGYFVPPEHAWKIGIFTNLIWLYRC